MQWESDIVCVCETAEKRGMKELSGNTIHTLKRLLIEVNTHTTRTFIFPLLLLAHVAMAAG